MLRFFALLGFVVFMWLPLSAQNRPGDKTPAVKKDTATTKPAPPVAAPEDKDGDTPPPPATNGSSVLFAVKSTSSVSSAIALATRVSNADKSGPVVALRLQMASITPDQLQATARKEVNPVKFTQYVIDTKMFATRNKIIPQPPVPHEVLVSIKIQDSMRVVEFVRAQQELGNTEANGGTQRKVGLNTLSAPRMDAPDNMNTLPNERFSGQDKVSGTQKTVGLNAVTAPRMDGPDKMNTLPNGAMSGKDNVSGPQSKAGALPAVTQGGKENKTLAQLVAAGKQKGANKKGEQQPADDKNAGNKTVVAPEEVKSDPKKDVFDKSVFNEMDSKKYPVIIEMPKDTNAANVNGGDFPKPYTTKKKKIRLFLSADENVELPVEQIVTVRYPRLRIEIKLADENVHNIKDLKVMMTLTNNTTKTQTFLFDRPVRPGFAMWGASCKIVGANRSYIVKSESKPEYEAHEIAKKDFEHYAFKIKASEWFIKKFSIADIVVLDESLCPDGNLPSNTYSMQLIFQGNYSNVITFTVN